MSNEYYTASGTPVTASQGSSGNMRSEFALIVAGFNLLPALSGNGNKVITVNSAGTALIASTTITFAGNFRTTGAFNTTLVQGASVSLTLPLINSTLATLAAVETLTNKTLVAPHVTGGMVIAGDVTVSGDLTTATSLGSSGPITSQGLLTTVTGILDAGGINTLSGYSFTGTQVVGARDTGWTAMTGSTNKATSYATSTVTLAQLAGRVMALQAALTTHGLLGT